MEPRYRVVPVSWTRGYVLDTKNGKRIGNDMALEKAHEQAKNLNQINEMMGDK